MRNIAQNAESNKWFDGREKWPAKKREAEKIGLKLSQLSQKFHKRAERVTQCAHQLETRSCPEHDGHYHAVSRAILCKDRACPVCNWRRSRAYAAKLLEATKRAGGRYLHLVFTVPNPEDGQLKATRERMTKAFGAMMRSARLRGVVGGCARSLETTRNATWHPHIHALVRVEESYFRSALYLEQAEWLQLWRDHYGDETITQVHVSAIPADELNAAVAEVCKYTTKTDDLLDLTLAQLEEYLDAMRYARLFDTSGCLRVAESEVEDDLLHNADEAHEENCPVCGSRLQKYNWHWNERAKKYERVPYPVSWPQKNNVVDRLRRRRRTQAALAEASPHGGGVER